MTPKQKAIEHLKKKTIYELLNEPNAFSEAIDLAVEETARQIFKELEEGKAIKNEELGFLSKSYRSIREKWLGGEKTK